MGATVCMPVCVCDVTGGGGGGGVVRAHQLMVHQPFDCWSATTGLEVDK